MQAIRWWLFVTIGFYLCGILTVIPLPLDFQWYRPQWMLMFILFCQLKQPALFNPLLAWVAGLLIDSLLGTPLGEHGFVFAIICYIAGYLRTHFMARPLALQIDKIFLLICLGQIFILWFHVLAGQNPSTLLYWVGSIMSCMLWPVFVILLHKLSECMNIAPYSSRSI